VIQMGVEAGAGDELGNVGGVKRPKLARRATIAYFRQALIG